MRAGPAIAVLAAVILVGTDVREAAAFFERTEVGARGVAMGRAYSALADDASAIYWNPGGLANLKEPEAFLTHYRPFLVQDLSLNFAALAWPTRHGSFWGAWSRLGLTDAMAEDLFYLGAARKIELAEGRSVSAGASLKIARVDFQGEVVTATGVEPAPAGQTELAGDFGVLVQWSPRLTAGWVVRNIGEPSFDFVPGGGGSRVEIVHEGGVAYRWHPESTVALALVEGSQRKLTPVAGAEIRFYDVFDLRAGVGDLKFYGGVGVRTDHLRVDTAFVTHNTLGISTMVSVTVPIGGWR